MFHALFVLGLIAAIGFGVNWIERGAAAKIEARNLAIAAQVQRESTADVTARSEAAAEAHRKETAGLKREIARLKARKASVPKAKPLGKYCRPGCKVRRRE